MRTIILPLTSLRFLAAAFVVIFHYNLTRQLFPVSLANFGYEAVTFFFILSGFVLAYAHGTPGAGINVAVRTFLFARLVRICPAYYLAILSIFLLFYVAGVLDRITIGQVLPVIFMVQAWVRESALSLNPPAWSISNEMFFYLTFPALWSVNRLLSAPFFIAASAALIVSVEFLRIVSSSGVNGNILSQYSPLANLPQFIYGIGLGYCFLVYHGSGRLPHQILFFAGLGFVVSLILLKSSANFLINDVTLCCAFGPLILGAAGVRGQVKRILSSRALVVLGDASYSIYILHFPVWLWWNHYTRVVYKVDWPSSVDFGMYLTILLATSLATLFFLEKPARRRLLKYKLRTK